MEIEAPTPDGPSNPPSKSRFEAASGGEKRIDYCSLEFFVVTVISPRRTRRSRSQSRRKRRTRAFNFPPPRPAFATRCRPTCSSPRNSMKSVANKTCLNSVGAPLGSGRCEASASLVGVGVAPGVALPSEHIACGRCRGREHDPFLGVESRCESSRARRRDGPTHDHSCEGKFALDRKDVGAIPSADLAPTLPPIEWLTCSNSNARPLRVIRLLPTQPRSTDERNAEAL